MVARILRHPDDFEQVMDIVDDIFDDDTYQLHLLGKHNRIEWTSGEGAEQKVWHVDPETTRFGRIVLDALSPFAPEELL